MIYYEKISEFLTKAKQIEQTSKYHKENLYIHSIICANNLLNNTNSKVYVLAGLLHDTGKIETRKIGKYNNWTFYGHAFVSAKNLEQYISKDDILFKPIYNLIFCHMMFYECSSFESEIKFLQKYNYEKNFWSNVKLFNDSDEFACIKEEKHLQSNQKYDIIKNNIFCFLRT